MKKRPKSRKDAENMISLPLKFDEVESVEEFVNMVKREIPDESPDDRRKPGCGCGSPYERYRSI